MRIEFIKPDFAYHSRSGNARYCVPYSYDREAEELLQQQVFPGNVRMLKNSVERAAILCGDGEIDADDLGFDLFEGAQIADSSVEHVVQATRRSDESAVVSRRFLP